MNNPDSIESKKWTLLSNHAHVLICLARDPSSRLRDVSLDVGITERAVQKIVADLENANYLSREKNGRCNSYRFNKDEPLRHKLESNHQIGELLKLLV